MISKTKIDRRKKRKTSSELVETIELAKKKGLLDLAKKLSGPTRLQKKVNLGELSDFDKEVVVVGKVLGQGQIDKKIKVFALGFSEQAKEKLKKSGCETGTIKEILEKNRKINEASII